MDRIQTKSVVSECTDFGSFWQCQAVYQTEEAAGWLDLFQPPVYKSDNTQMIQIQSQLVSSNPDRHYKHIAKIDISSGAVLNYLTTGAYTVTTILGWDDVTDTIYFMGTLPDIPGVRHMYSVSGAASGPSETCITCSLNMPTAQAPCSYSYISFSPDFKVNHMYISNRFTVTPL